MGLVETAQQWLDWAYGTYGEQRWDDSAYNLAQFQSIYDSSAYAGPTAAEKAALDKMNGKAALLRAMISERQTWATSSAWWAPFLPGTARQNITQAGADATAEARRAAQLAADAGDTLTARQAAILAGETVNETNVELAGAPNAYTDFLNMSPLGIPLWAWAVGGVGLIFLLKRR